ncbi:MAG: NAD(P)H-dependent oxidoreductase [Lentisphaeria bacterium]|nr:NAD(P)H-dependent oxidoreductase [Lentisphaeria bacterium]
MNIVLIGGSIREGSYNQALLRFVGRHLRLIGHEADEILLREYPMPFMDEDYEREYGLPNHAKVLRHKINMADALIIASPEYNGSFSGVLKNAIDWVSRPGDTDDPPAAIFKDKKVGFMSASPGGYGGQRGLAQIRYLFEAIHAAPIQEDFSLANAYQFIDGEGNWIDEQPLKEIEQFVKQLLQD